MQVALGVDTWTRGLRTYLQDHVLEAADSADLYTALQKVVDQDYPESTPNVAEIMGSWENQGGFPVILVTRNPSNRITLSQERFLYTSGRDSSLWQIPINYVVGSNPNFADTKPDMWMTTRSMNIPAETAPKTWTLDDWIILNIQESSYYRVNYDVNLWSLLIQQLHSEPSKIHSLNRAQLVDDSLNLARGDHNSYNVAFDILLYLESESDYPPWAAVSFTTSIQVFIATLTDSLPFRLTAA